MRLAKYPGSAAIRAGLSVNLAGINVADLGSTFSPCAARNSSGLQPQMMASLTRIKNRTIPVLSGTGKSGF